MSKKKKYWFRINFGKWIDDEFDSDYSSVFVESWDAGGAIRKAENNINKEPGEIIIGVDYLGFKQL